MSHADEARYGRACLLLLSVCPFTLRRVIDDYSLRHAGSLSLCDFLEKNKERLFHLYKRECCCGHKSNKTPMYQSQWDSLYDRNTSTCLNGKRIDCPCKYDGKTSAATNVMDVTLCCLVINNICPGVDVNHIKTIREISNKLIHAETARLDLLTFYRYVNRVKTAICELAKNVSTMLHTETLEMIVELENRLMDPVELRELWNLIIDERRITDLEANVSNIADDVAQISASVSETTEKVTQISASVSKTTEKVNKIEDQTQRELSQIREIVDKRSMRENMKGFLKEGIITVPHSRGILIGCLGAGKTTLLKRLQGKDKQAIEETESTRGLEVHFHAFEIKDGRLEVCVNDMQQHQFLGISTAELEPKEEQQKFDTSPEASNPTGFSHIASRVYRFVGRKYKFKATGRISDDQIENILTEKEKTFKITMVDIAGQLAYYACHQTYFTSKAFYILVLDMTKPFEEIVEKEKTDSFFSTWTYGDYLKFWIDSIKTFGNKKAPVFLVASHAEEKTDDEINEYFEDVFNLVPEDKDWLEKIVGGKTYAFALKDFSDDKTKKQLDSLKQEMVQVVQTEIGSSLKVRASWALVEDVLRKSKKKIASRSEIWQIEETIGSDYHFANDDEMTNFLSFFHDHGFLLYFNEAHLREHVILDIQWFVNAFSIIVADKTHFLHDNSERNEVKEQWKKFDETGVLPNELLKALWENDETILRHQNIVLSYMEKLRMIAAIDGKWYVPCMNKRQEKAQMHELDENSNYTILRREYAIFPYFRLIAHNISILKWPVPFDEHANRQLFQTVTFFEYKHCSFAVRVREDEIQVVFREDISCKAQEKIVKALNEALVLITNTFYTHDSESYSSASKGKKAETSHKSETADYVVQPSIKRPRTETEINKGAESNINRQETDISVEEKLMSGPNRSDLEQLRETLRERKIDFVDAWVAKRCQNDEEVLVVEVLHSEQYEKLSIENTPVVYFNAVKSNESLEISLKDNETLRTFSKEEIRDAQRVMLQNRNEIMKDHSNVVEIEISGYKSKGYGTAGARCGKELTIAIQTRIKGFVPIGESMFPLKIGKYSTDVREAFVTSATNTPSDLHDPLKIGCSISTKGLLMHSTLCPFFKHPRKAILLSCSCAHGFIDPNHPSGNGIEFIVSQLIKKPVLQPHGDGNEFGIVYDAKIQHGYDNPGIDGTLIEINSRFPDCGSFPEISKENTLSAGFNDCPTFQNGTIEKEIGKLIGKEVVMFGQKSGFQRGTVQLYDANIEANVVRTTYGNFRYALSQQIKVLPIPKHDPDKGIYFPSPFAILGDSGAPIFIRDGDDLAIVGILTCVGAHGVGYFTPITNFLKAFDIDEIKFFHPFSGSSPPLNHLKCNGVLHKSPTTDQNSNHKNGEDEMDTS